MPPLLGTNFILHSKILNNYTSQRFVVGTSIFAKRLPKGKCIAPRPGPTAVFRRIIAPADASSVQPLYESRARIGITLELTAPRVTLNTAKVLNRYVVCVRPNVPVPVLLLSSRSTSHVIVCILRCAAVGGYVSTREIVF